MGIVQVPGSLVSAELRIGNQTSSALLIRSLW